MAGRFGGMGSFDAVHVAMPDLMRNEVVSGSVAEGDVVRLVRRTDGTWFYCSVDQVLDDGDLVCSVVEAQSWPNLVADGVVPGRRYMVPQGCVLSIVRHRQARR
jgi:hypothetical protein